LSFDEIEPTYGALQCRNCGRTYYYRAHVEAGGSENATLGCPECGQELQEALPDRFLDNSAELLSIMQGLEEELGEG